VRSCRLAVGVWQNSPPMKPRSIWTGHLKISLVTIPVRLFCALNEADKISFNQLHKGCHQRLKQQLSCPVHGNVEREVSRVMRWVERKVLGMLSISIRCSL